MVGCSVTVVAPQQLAGGAQPHLLQCTATAAEVSLTEASATETAITTIFPRIYARTYYAHPRARVMSFSAREPARFPCGNPSAHALRLQHMAHTLVQPQHFD